MTTETEARTSVCKHCELPIHWVTDGEGSQYGWWYTEQGWNLCPGTEEGYHRPADADEDNAAPAWRLEASFYIRAASPGRAHETVRRMLQAIPYSPEGLVGDPADDIHDTVEPWDLNG